MNILIIYIIIQLYFSYSYFNHFFSLSLSYIERKESSSFSFPILYMNNNNKRKREDIQDDLGSSLGDLSQEEKNIPEVSVSSEGESSTKEDISSEWTTSSSSDWDTSSTSTTNNDDISSTTSNNLPAWGRVTFDIEDKKKYIKSYNTDSNPNFEFIGDSENTSKNYEEVKKNIVKKVLESGEKPDIIHINNVTHNELPYNAIIYVDNKLKQDKLILLNNQDMIILPSDNVGQLKEDVKSLNQEDWDAIGHQDSNSEAIGALILPSGTLSIVLSLLYNRKNIEIIYYYYEYTIKLILLLLIYTLILLLIFI